MSRVSLILARINAWNPIFIHALIFACISFYILSSSANIILFHFVIDINLAKIGMLVTFLAFFPFTFYELKKINLGIDLLMYTSGRSSFRDKIFKREVTLNHPYPFDLGVIWSDPPRRMICLEPWTSPRNSFVDGFRNIMIPSNDSKRLNASIQIKSLK